MANMYCMKRTCFNYPNWKCQKKCQIQCCNILKNKEYQVKVHLKHNKQHHKKRTAH